MDRGKQKLVVVIYTQVTRYYRGGSKSLRYMYCAIELLLRQFNTVFNLASMLLLTRDNAYMFFGVGKIISRWICGHKEDDLPFYGIYLKPNPKTRYLKKTIHWKY